MISPNAEPTGRAVYLALRNLARAQGRSFAETLMLYKLQRTLGRLAVTPFADNLILKGGLLLAAYGARRPTKDIDAMVRDLTLNEQKVRDICTAIATVRAEDGLFFDARSLRIAEIREDADYVGFRASMTCQLHTDTQKVSLDFSTGDPLDPPAQPVTIAGLLGDHVTIQGYPPAMIVAEKTVTAITRGTTNTRWRDFVDLALLSRLTSFDSSELCRSLAIVSDHRRADLQPLRDTLAGYGTIGQAKYAAWRTKQAIDTFTPATFDELLAEVFAFIDPLLANTPTPGNWDPATREWLA